MNLIKLVKDNKFIFACLALFALVYFYGNNMEFYDNSTDSEPKQINQPSGEFYLDPTDDVVLKRKDLKILDNQLAKFKYDGLDNWNVNVPNKGWFASTVPVHDNLYTPPARLVWPD